MKIALIHFAAAPVVGGVESVMSHHAKLMAKAGHDVTIIAGRGAKTTKEINFKHLALIDSLEPEITELKKELDQGVVPEDFTKIKDKIKSSLKEQIKDMDAVFVHNIFTMAKNLSLTTALHELVKELKKVQFIAWHHDLAATAKRYKNELYSEWPWNLLFTKFEHPNLKHVAVSNMRKKEVKDILNINGISVIPSGIDSYTLYKFEEQSKEIFEELSILNHFPILLLPVRITRRKNIELALKISAELQKILPNSTLVITGPPGAHNNENKTYLEELLELKDELKVNAYFLYETSKGFLPDAVISDLYTITDILLMTSTEEGFGIPILEGALSRTPIFCSELEPFKEISNDKLNFFQLDDSPKEIAKRIAKLIKQDSSYELRHEIKSKYDWNSVYNNLIAPLIKEK